MIFARLVPLLAVSLWLISCSSQQDRSPALAQAFVGPATLGLRQELSTKAPVTATVHHGEPLDILEYKRRFIKVRTAGGIVGWTETHQLLTPEQMAELRHLAERAAAYPSQGTASTFEALNVHTEPSRTSPSFLQIPEGGKVDVIGHKVTPRVQPATPMPVPPPRPRLQRRKSKKGASVPPPPPPPAPKLPANWVDLSKTPQPLETKPIQNGPPQPPAHPDDWTLIRTKDGKAGWVLSRMLTMSIPDDVAQYAEGRRITSYFPIGDVHDGDQVKHNWLWTTIGKGPENYEFDSFRFFIWSLRHHRYETAYIQRDVVGHYPVEVSVSGSTPTFAVILEGEDGNLYKKTYTFNGYRVNVVDTARYEAPAQSQQQPQPSLAMAQTQADQRTQSWYTSIRERLSKMLHR